jgi:hypothetical protein
MSEGDVKPSAPVVAEAHGVDTFHVPQAFFKYDPILFASLRSGGVKSAKQQPALTPSRVQICRVEDEEEKEEAHHSTCIENTRNNPI